MEHTNAPRFCAVLTQAAMATVGVDRVGTLMFTQETKASEGMMTTWLFHQTIGDWLTTQGTTSSFGKGAVTFVAED